MQPVEGIERCAAAVYPIIASGDVTGAVIMMSDEAIRAYRGRNQADSDRRGLLGRQLEE